MILIVAWQTGRWNLFATLSTNISVFRKQAFWFVFEFFFLAEHKPVRVKGITGKVSAKFRGHYTDYRYVCVTVRAFDFAFQSIVISHFTFHYLLHLGCIGYGGLICRIKEAKVCSLYRPLIWSSRRKVSAICFLYFIFFAFKVATTRGRVSKLLHEKWVLKNSDFRAPKN